MYVFYAYSNVQCCKLFTLCSVMQYTYMTVLCMCIHSAYCTICCPKCIMLHRKSCYSFSRSLFCNKACTGAGGQGTAALHSYTLMRRVSIWQKVEDVEGIALDREQPLMSQANEEGILLCVQPSQKMASSPIYPILVHTTHNIC